MLKIAQTSIIKTALRASGILVLALLGVAVLAQAYPAKPIRLQVPFESGGTSDIIARAIAGPLGKALGQSVDVEYRPGNGGALAGSDIANSPPDGYLLGLATVSTAAANPAFNPRILYNAATDFTAIINIAVVPQVFAVHPGFAAKDYKGLLELLKKAPNQYAYASAGNGSDSHLRMALFQALTGTAFNHQGYRGASAALKETTAGGTHMALDYWPSAGPLIQNMTLRPIVVAAPKRLPNLPQVPTFAEVGLEPLNRLAYFGIYAPQGLPKALAEKINAALRKVLEDPAVRKQIEGTGAMIVANSPAEFAAEMKTELAFYKRMVETVQPKWQ